MKQLETSRKEVTILQERVVLVGLSCTKFSEIAGVKNQGHTSVRISQD